MKINNEDIYLFDLFADDGFGLDTSKKTARASSVNELINLIFELPYYKYPIIRVNGLGEELIINGEREEDWIEKVKDMWTYVSCSRASEIVGVDTSVLRRHLIKKTISGKKIGSDWLVKLESLIDYYQE